MLELFKGRFQEKTPPAQRPEAEPTEQGPALSRMITYGQGHGESAQVVFSNPALNIRKVIVDEAGNILDSLGVELTERLMRCLEDHILPPPRIFYRTEFRREPDGRFLMVWEIQPDGRYWADEGGFGGTSDPEIRLYAHIDERGRFTEPFRLYKVGADTLYNRCN